MSAPGGAKLSEPYGRSIITADVSGHCLSAKGYSDNAVIRTISYSVIFSEEN